MKLLFCPECSDMFKLVIYQERSCKCGKVKGQLLDANNAVANGQGISVAIANSSLMKSVYQLQQLDQNRLPDYYKENTRVECWVRPQTGLGNPRTTIMKEGLGPKKENQEAR